MSNSVRASNRSVWTRSPAIAPAASGVTNSCAARGHHDAHGCAALPQAPDQVERFVGRDAAADDEEDAFAGQPDTAVVRLRRAGRHEARGLRDRAGGTFGRGGRSRAGREMQREEMPGLFFHRAAVARSAQAQAPFDVVVELADREAGHLAVLILGGLHSV